MTERLIAWAVRNRMAVLALVAITIASGFWALRTLSVEALPDLTDVQVQVLVEAPGLSPVEVERLVAAPIEVAMAGLPGVVQARSISKYGFAAVTIVFRDGTDVYVARSLVNERLQGARESLPDQAEASLGPLAGAISEIYLYTVEAADEISRNCARSTIGSSGRSFEEYPASPRSTPSADSSGRSR